MMSPSSVWVGLTLFIRYTEKYFETSNPFLQWCSYHIEGVNSRTIIYGEVVTQFGNLFGSKFLFKALFLNPKTTLCFFRWHIQLFSTSFTNETKPRH